MRTQVKQEHGRIIVRAVADDGTVVGVLEADTTYLGSADEHRMMAYEDACTYCMDGQYAEANEITAELDKEHRCMGAAIELMPGLGSYDDQIVALTKVDVTAAGVWGEEREAAVHLYRTAVIAAGRRRMPFMAEACGVFFSYVQEVPEGLSAWVFKQPDFQRDMQIRGPVALYSAQLALGPGRVANMRRALLR